MTDRLSVNVNDECADALRRVTASRGISVTEAIRRAIALLDYFEKQSRTAAYLVDGSRIWQSLDDTQETTMTPDESHTASHVLDLVDPNTEERFALYRCNTCFAVVVSEDAADHGHWHAATSSGATCCTCPDPEIATRSGHVSQCRSRA